MDDYNGGLFSRKHTPEFHISVTQMFASIHEQASGKNDTVHGFFLLRLGTKCSKYNLINEETAQYTRHLWKNKQDTTQRRLRREVTQLDEDDLCHRQIQHYRCTPQPRYNCIIYNSGFGDDK